MSDDRSRAPASWDWLTLSEGSDYSATLTGNPFLFFESRILLELMETEPDHAAIRDRVVAGNLFQYRTTKSVPKRVNALLVRLSPLPDELRRFLITAQPSEAKKVLILVLMARDRLFRELMMEVYAPKRPGFDEAITDGDFIRFFHRKAEAEPRVDGWGDQAVRKLRTNMTAALAEAGLIDNPRSRRVVRAVLDAETRAVVRRWFPPHYSELLEGTA